MLSLASVGPGQHIHIKPALTFNSERDAYTCPIVCHGKTMLLVVTQARLRRQLDEAISSKTDLARVFDPESYRDGEGVSLDESFTSEPSAISDAAPFVSAQEQETQHLQQCEEQLRYLDLLSAAVEHVSFGQDTAAVRSFFQIMADQKRATLNEALADLEE